MITNAFSLFRTWVVALENASFTTSFSCVGLPLYSHDYNLILQRLIISFCCRWVNMSLFSCNWNSHCCGALIPPPLSSLAIKITEVTIADNFLEFLGQTRLLRMPKFSTSVTFHFSTNVDFISFGRNLFIDQQSKWPVGPHPLYCRFVKYNPLLDGFCVHILNILNTDFL